MKKRLFIAISITVIAIIAIMVSASSIAKYLIEKYSVSYCGRKITLEHIYLNPLTGHIHLLQLKIFEAESDSLFFSAKELSINVSLYKLFSKTYEVNEISLDEPEGVIIQHNKKLNFDDIIKRFTPVPTDALRNPVHFSILSIRMNRGKFLFRENEIPIQYSITEVYFKSNGFRWNNDTIEGNVSFLSGKSASKVQGDFNIDYKTLDYSFSIKTQKLDLDIINQYLKPLVNYGTFRATLDADIRAKGNFNEEENITVKGVAAVNNMHFGKDIADDYISFDNLSVDINELSPKFHTYLIHSISLNRPYFNYEQYDHLDNLETMFGVKGSNIQNASADHEKFNLVIELLRYSKVLVKNFFMSSYKINKLSINKGNLKFNDYALNELFTVSASPFNISGDSLDKSRKRVYLAFKTALKPYGNAVLYFNINPNDSADFAITYRFQNIPISVFNPYILSYTSYSLNRGTIEFSGNWLVQNGMIKSVNHILLIDPRINGRIKNRNNRWEPLPLIMAFTRERENIIDYEIPITGNLKNPKFHFGDVIKHLLENIFIKPATLPYAMHVRSSENEIEKSLTLQWQRRQYELPENEIKFLHKMAAFLKAHPAEIISFYPTTYEEKEKEQILFFEAKKYYFLKINRLSFLSESDSLLVEHMSIKDSAFNRYLELHTAHGMLFTIQQKCGALIKEKALSLKFNLLLKQRENALKSCFRINNTDSRLVFHPNKNAIPYNGLSCYTISSKGPIPDDLISAYRTMHKFDTEAPRNKYIKEIKENENTTIH